METVLWEIPYNPAEKHFTSGLWVERFVQAGPPTQARARVIVALLEAIVMRLPLSHLNLWTSFDLIAGRDIARAFLQVRFLQNRSGGHHHSMTSGILEVDSGFVKLKGIVLRDIPYNPAEKHFTSGHLHCCEWRSGSTWWKLLPWNFRSLSFQDRRQQSW